MTFSGLTYAQLEIYDSHMGSNALSIYVEDWKEDEFDSFKDLFDTVVYAYSVSLESFLPLKPAMSLVARVTNFAFCSVRKLPWSTR